MGRRLLSAVQLFRPQSAQGANAAFLIRQALRGFQKLPPPWNFARWFLSIVFYRLKIVHSQKNLGFQGSVQKLLVGGLGFSVLDLIFNQISRMCWKMIAHLEPWWEYNGKVARVGISREGGQSTILFWGKENLVTQIAITCLAKDLDFQTFKA